VFLFNVGGYYLVFWGLRISNDKIAWNKIEKSGYDESNAITIKMPMNLPYPMFQSDFHQTHDKFEYKGEFYKSVKQKIEGDTLYVVCVKDLGEKRLVNTMTKYAKESNDLPGHEKNQTSLSKLLKEYVSISAVELIQSAGWCYTQCPTEDLLSFASRTSAVVIPPPRS
jgi:hypothetical protein